tara:strand:- start:112557 stop:113504 length:948 start_codon:yes stop_codon:yes gene_type:complete
MNTRPGDITLELERIRLAVNPRLGGSITGLMVKDQHTSRWTPVLRTMSPHADSPSDAGSFVMAPWTNRIKDAVFKHDGQTYTLRSNNSDGSAIHGYARDAPWKITDRSPITARLVLDSRTCEPELINYPFHFGAVQRFEISPDAVEIELSITNLDAHPIPVGCGHHPYIHRHLFSDDDDLRIKLDVDGRYPTAGCIPTGEPISDDVCTALGKGEPIGNPGLDDVFSGFGGQATFDWNASNTRMTMSCSSNLNHVVIYTPRDESGSANEFVCVEPVTMVNNGFNRLAQGQNGTGVQMLAPNESLRTTMRLAFSSMK